MRSVAAALLLLCSLYFSAEAAPAFVVANGSPVQVWACGTNEYLRQLFYTQIADPVEQIFNIIFQYDGKCLDLQNYNTEPNAQVAVYDCHPNNNPENQQWRLNFNGTITSVMDGGCLSVMDYGSGSFLGSAVVVNPCDGSALQQWTYDVRTSTIKSGVGYCMDIGSGYTCQDAVLSGYSFCNYTLPVETRVKDLVSRLNPTQLYMQMGNTAPAIGELGVPAYQWWTECLHGVLTPCGETCPTSFPAASMMGASFNMSLIHEIAQAISTEARALHNQGIGGLDFWAPNININRDPRWGRNQEVPGEDPYLTGQYVTNFMRGLQEGVDPDYVKVVGTCKHYAAYSLENWGGQQRYGFNAIVSDYDLVDTYLPAWQACVVEGRARSVMCSYNAVNGIPTCANDFLLQTILRDQFEFDGYVVSDCDAVACIEDNHNYTTNPAATCGVAVGAGCDLNCGSFYQSNMGAALAKGTVTVAQLQKSVGRLFKQRFELGMWDPPQMQYYTRLPPSVVDSPAHSYLALRAARESIILLKNEGSLLPLPKTVKRVAVIGPNANVTDTLLSNYYGQRCLDGSFNCITTPLNAIKQMLPNAVINYALGCDVSTPNMSLIPEAFLALSKSDVGIVFLGLNQGVESEGQDRYNITLPGAQMNLITALTATGKPIVVVLINGGSVSIEWIKDNIPAIVEAGYPGENGAQAIAEVLFGDYNPGGKLTVTVYPADFVNEVPLTNMSMRAAVNNPGRTYRYYTGKPLWEFGFGLSYTTFKTTWINSATLPAAIAPADVISFRVKVQNVGSVAGDEVVLAFISRNNTDNGPLKQLFGFQRVHLMPDETKELFFSSSPNTLAVPTGVGSDQVIHPGKYNIEIGVGENKLVHPFTVVGKPLYL